MSQMLNETLRQSRKRSGMTQEQLAEKVHVSRQSISNWETGRAAPDYEMLKTLSETLETPLMELLGMEEEPPAAEEPEAAEPAQETAQEVPAEEPAAPAPQRKWYMAALCVLVAAVAMLSAGIASWWQSRPVPPPYPQEWFMEDMPVVEGKAHADISVIQYPVAQKTSSGQMSWRYEVIVREDNGVGFTIDQCIAYTFLADGGHLVTVTSGKDFASGLSRNYVSAGAVRMYDAGEVSESPIVGRGFILEGTDDHGNAISARCFVPYLTEENR